MLFETLSSLNLTGSTIIERGKNPEKINVGLIDYNGRAGIGVITIGWHIHDGINRTTEFNFNSWKVHFIANTILLSRIALDPMQCDMPPHDVDEYIIVIPQN